MTRRHQPRICLFSSVSGKTRKMAAQSENLAPHPTGLPRALEWIGGSEGALRLLDQTLLPSRIEFLDCRSAEQVHEAIRRLRVRGAPAIGVAAAYGLCLGAREARDQQGGSMRAFRGKVADLADYLCDARPTAVNLAWAVRRVQRTVDSTEFIDGEAAWNAMLTEAHAISREDAEVCRRIGENGARLIRDGMGVLTHCNAGALATTAYGTALSVMYAAKAQGRRFNVFADETRPLLQGARLTAFELAAAGIDVTVICDHMAASVMKAGRVQLVIVGADRIAANGDTANKIGTYGLAVLARHHKVPFFVAAPQSTIDVSLDDGAGIPIEQRSESELRKWGGVDVVPASAKVYNPAFDVTPAELLSGIVTEAGILEPVSGVFALRENFPLRPCKPPSAP